MNASMRCSILLSAMVLLVLQAVLLPVGAQTTTIKVEGFTHTPESPEPGQDIHVTVNVSGNDSIKTVQVQTCVGQTCQLPEPLTLKSGTIWEGTITGKKDDQTNKFNDKDNVEVSILVKYGNDEYHTAENVHSFLVSALPPDPDKITKESDCEAAGFYWYGGKCHAKDRDAPGNYTTNATCVAVDYFWYNGSCHADPQKTPGNCTTQAECSENGYNWWNGSCHVEQKPPEPSDFKDMQGCEKAGFYWYDEKCNAVPPPKKDGKKNGPGFELVLLVAAFAAAVVVMSMGRKEK